MSKGYFANIPEDDNRRERIRFERPVWFVTTEGQHQIRILDETAHDEWLHFVRTPTHERGIYLTCLEDDCPICIQNRQIIAENPETFRDVKGYWSRSKRWYVNVLDRTEVKVCPECQWENKKDVTMQFPNTCLNRECNALLTEVEPHQSGKVKILAKGKRLFEPLEKNIFRVNVDEDGEPIPLTKYDIILHVVGTGRDTQTLPVKTDVNDEVGVPEDALYDLPSIPLRLEPSEVLDFLKGVSLRDIFAARRGEVDEEMQELAEEIKEDIDEGIASILA